MVEPAQLGYRLPLDGTVARHAIHAGLGRTVLHVRECGVEGIEDLILDACSHARAYDPQCEPDRAAWILGILDLAEMHDSALEHVAATLGVSTDTWDLDPAADVALGLAKRGDNGARAILHDALERQAGREYWPVAHQVIELDGTEGLLLVGKRLGARLRVQPDFWLDDSLMRLAGEVIGAEAAETALREAAAHDADVAMFANAMYETDEARIEGAIKKRDAEREQLAGLSAIEMLGALDDAAQPTWPYKEWGRRASDGELSVIMRAIVTESDPKRLIRLLWVFSARAIPEADAKVISLIDHDDPMVSHRAAYALSNTRHSAIRVAALGRLRSGPDRNAMLMMESSVDFGDAESIMRVLPLGGDSEFIHGLASSIVAIYDQGQLEDGVGPLTWAYDRSPCSNCRLSALRGLRALAAIPSWVATEAPFDSNQQIARS